MITESLIETNQIETDLLNLLSSYKANNLHHTGYMEEISIYDMVKMGDIEGLSKVEDPFIKSGMGILSTDYTRNIRYHLIIGTALISRFCIEGGLSPEEASYTSKQFIKMADNCNSVPELEQIHSDMLFTFAQKMKNLRKMLASSSYIRKAIEYINDHLHEQIQMKSLSEYVGLSDKYLSSLFKKETKMTTFAYIEKARIQKACTLLRYTDMTYAEIADSLAFCSHSYFSSVFKRHCNMTPLQYRSTYKSQHFIDLDS